MIACAGFKKFAKWLGLIALASLALGSTLHTAQADTSPDADSCGALVAVDAAPSKQINLVLDDSGTMFKDFRTNTPLTRWSHAKYSLGVFAALMGPNDVLSVYRLSDFVGADQSRTAYLNLEGSASPVDNVKLIDEMPMKGRGTPFESVQGAFADLTASDAQQKWLVVLTDGKFRVPDGDGGLRDIEQDELQELIAEFAENGNQQEIQIAYLALGDDIPTVSSQPRLRIFGEQAVDADALLGRVERFANLIFGRDQLPASAFVSRNPAVAAVDLDMEQMIVFAQGANVEVGPLRTEDGTIDPSATVNVKWSENPFQVMRGTEPVESIPDKRLEGQVKYFEDVRKGNIGFSVANAQEDLPVVFYKPNVYLGYELQDVNGQVIPGNVVEAGDYRVVYGFQDSDCNFVDSPLLGDVEYLAQAVTVDGQVVSTGFKSGDVIAFPEGTADIALSASYLEGTRVDALFTRDFARPAFASAMQAQVPEFLVSELGEYQSDSAAIRLTYSVVEDGGIPRPPSVEEWANLDPTTFQFESDSNLDFDLKKLDEPGQLLLRLRAPNGDVFAADTGDLDVTVRGSYAGDRPDVFAEETVAFEVKDDISAWDRFVNFMKTTGWKILLALLLLTLLAGYLTKKRFSKKVKARPSITGTPKTVGVTAVEDRGKFQAGGFRKFLPFVANTATLSYVPPGTIGFRPMKLKAGPQKSMIVTNWKEIAEKENVEINGTPLNKETKRAPKLRAGSTISASTPQMTYELTPST